MQLSQETEPNQTKPVPVFIYIYIYIGHCFQAISKIPALNLISAF